MAITEEKALIKIASETSGAQIRYTINGEDPTESDTLYTSSGVELDYGDVLRAKAFKSGSMPSAVNVYKNRTPIVSVEKFLSINEINSDISSSNKVYWIKKVNNIWFLSGLKYSSGTTVLLYSNDLQTWKEVNRNSTTRYIWDIEYFKEKYILLESASAYDTTYNAYSSLSEPYLIYLNNLESGVEKETAINGSNFPFLSGLRDFKGLSLYVTVNRLIVLISCSYSPSSNSGSKSGYIHILYTEDLNNFNGISNGNSYSATSSNYMDKIIYPKIIYINGYFYTWMYYQGSTSLYIYRSNDLLNWQRKNIPFSGYSNTIYSPGLYFYNGNIYIFYYDSGDNNGIYKIPVLNDLGDKTLILKKAISSYDMTSFAGYEDNIIFNLDSNIVIFNLNLGQELKIPSNQLPSSYGCAKNPIFSDGENNYLLLQNNTSGDDQYKWFIYKLNIN